MKPKLYIYMCLGCFFLVCSELLNAQNPAGRVGGKIRLDLPGGLVAGSELKAKLLERGIDIDTMTTASVVEVLPTLEAMLQKYYNDGKAYLKDSILNDLAHLKNNGDPYMIGYQAGGGRPIVAPPQVLPKADPPAEEEKVPAPAPKDFSCRGEGVYGQHIFKDKTLELFEVSDDVKAPKHYILGVGDELTITIFGASQGDLKFTINQEGFIAPEGMRRIFLKGLTFEEAQKVIVERFKQSYLIRRSQIFVRITSARSVRINIFGEVEQNGSYTIPATNSAFNAIVAAGGPTNMGGIRAIQLVRGDEIRELDVYEFLSDPSIARDFQLKENDIIHVPVVDREVTLFGAVRRPCTYELLPEENLFDLIVFAGGLEPEASTDQVQVKRYVNNERVLIDVDLEAIFKGNETFELLKGDTVTIKSVYQNIQNYVTVSGAVEQEGRFAFSHSMRISHLLEKSKLLPMARTDVAYLIRTHLDFTKSIIRVPLDSVLQNPGGEADLKLKPKDEIMIFQLETFAEKAIVSSIGAVRTPKEMPYDRSHQMRLQDLILLSGGLQANAAQYGYIKRVDLTNREKVDYLKVDLFGAMGEGEPPENILIKPYDQLIVYTKEKFYDLYQIEIEGAVREPGIFDFDESLYLSELIYLAGGLQSTATGKGYILRSALENPDAKTYIEIDLNHILSHQDKDILLQPMDYVLVMDSRNYTDTYKVKVLGAVNNPGEFVYGDSMEVKDLITLAGGLKFSAAKNHIDVYRLDPTRTAMDYQFVSTIEVDEQFRVILSPVSDSTLFDDQGKFLVKPFDQFIVREVPGFDTQKMVKIEGEILYPGYYVITDNNQTIADLVAQAGGLTDAAYPQGTTLYRVKGNRGFVVFQLNNAMKDISSNENIPILEGDLIIVPKRENVVFIETQGTLAGDLYPDRFKDIEQISVAFQGKRSAKWYVEKFAAGFSKSAKKKYTTVERANKRIVGTSRPLVFMQYPKVYPGSTILIGEKNIRKKSRRFRDDDEPVDWEKVFAKTLTTATSVLGLVVLIAQINR